VLEAELASPVRRHLERAGYRVWVDPDGSGYFDVVARRGTEVGLVELKIADWRRVFEQALRRRGWADWVAVALPRASLAARLVQRPGAPRAARVGIWVVGDAEIRVLREARPLVGDGETDPFPLLKAQLAESLDLLDRGDLGPGVRWGFAVAPSPSRRAGRRGATREWRLEEFEPDPVPDPPPEKPD
jgi:hypothetical protein